MRPRGRPRRHGPARHVRNSRFAHNSRLDPSSQDRRLVRNRRPARNSRRAQSSKPGPRQRAVHNKPGPKLGHKSSSVRRSSSLGRKPVQCNSPDRKAVRSSRRDPRSKPGHNRGRRSIRIEALNLPYRQNPSLCATGNHAKGGYRAEGSSVFRRYNEASKHVHSLEGCVSG
jgi:hypothetical protein